MSNTLSIAFLQGFAMMGSLIIAIGIQNAFILKQGVKQQAVFITATICFICDAFLISIGAAGLGELFANSRTLNFIITFGGAMFLMCYAVRSFYAVKTTKGLNLKSSEKTSRSNTVLVAFAVSLLNPHAILDTIVLVGGLAAHYKQAARWACAFGGVTASGIWFYSLAYGARQLAPILSKPKVWRIIDFIIGLMMLALALALIRELFYLHLRK